MDNKSLELPITHYVPSSRFMVGSAICLFAITKFTIDLRQSFVSGDVLLIQLVYAGMILGCIIGMISCGLKLVNRQLVFQIDREGIRAWPRQHLISWPEIREIRYCKTSKSEGIAIFLENPKAYIAQYKGFLGWNVRMTRKLTGTPAFIVTRRMGIDGETLAAQLDTYLRTIRKPA